MTRLPLTTDQLRHFLESGEIVVPFKRRPKHRVLCVNGVWLDADGIMPGRNIKCHYAIGETVAVLEHYKIEKPFTGKFEHDYDSRNWTVVYYADDHPKYRDKDQWESPETMPEHCVRHRPVIQSISARHVGERWCWVLGIDNSGNP